MVKHFTPNYRPNRTEIAKRFPKLTEGQIQEIIQYWKTTDEDVRHMGDLALAYGISHSQLDRLLAEYGYKKHARYKTFHEEELLEALDEFEVTSLSQLREILNDHKNQT